MITKTNALATLAEIRVDAERETRELEGKPFSGKTVGMMFGNVLAQIDTLCAIMQAIIKGEIE